MTKIMLDQLKRAGPWIKFVGVLGFIEAGFMTAGGIFFILVMPHLLYAQYYSGASSSGLFYITTGIISFFPSFFTYRFGNKIKKFFLTGENHELEQALKNNKLFWKFTGIFLIAFLSIFIVAVFISLFFFSYTL